MNFTASVNRRQFLEGSLACGALICAGGAADVPAQKSGKPAAGKIGDFKISLAEWSLHKALFADKIDNLDFPKIAREEYGIEGVEFVNQFFKDKAHDSAYLKDLKKRADDQGVTCVLIMIDGEGDLSDEKQEADQGRGKPQEMGRRRGGAGMPRHPRQHGPSLQPDERGTVAEACGMLTDYGAKNEIKIICENHGGPSSNPDALIALMKAVSKSDFGTLPDFGNFPRRTGSTRSTSTTPSPG